jgi:hypothetical protein
MTADIAERKDHPRTAHANRNAQLNKDELSRTVAIAS